MEDDPKEESLRNAVRSRLREQNIQLWTPPYVQEDGGPNINVIEKLACEFSSHLMLEKNDCLKMLINLQSNALKRIEEKKHLHSVTLQIRFSGLENHELPTSTAREKTFKDIVEVEISEAATGGDLAKVLSGMSGKPADQMKLVTCGRILKSEKSLRDQGVKSSSRIMAIMLNTRSSEDNATMEYQKICEKTRSAASTLSNDRNEYASFQVENQGGSALRLDPKEKKALCVALALHERGRSALKRGDHNLALLLLLEADQEFGQCNSELLKSVDNVALLQLDIVWCYLCLRSISHIPDARMRLDQCEVALLRSYSENLARVEALNGTTANEEVLFMRLHLLQAILAFHSFNLVKATELLKKAELELLHLKVNSDDVSKLVALGYSNSEAIWGLRATCGDLDAAVLKILEWKEKKRKARELNRKEREKERERVKLGKTADGSNYIEPDCVDTLCEMGYDRNLVISALKHSNNVMTQAVHLLQEQPHLLDVKKKVVCISADDVTQIAAMGFDTDVARLALRKHNGSIEAAVADLVSNGGLISVDPDLLSADQESDATDDRDNCGNLEGVEDKRKRKRMEVEQIEAQKELENDITDTGFDYLCVNLEAEEEFLNGYKKLLNL